LEREFGSNLAILPFNMKLPAVLRAQNATLLVASHEFIFTIVPSNDP